jgi:hypothetical protein
VHSKPDEQVSISPAPQVSRHAPVTHVAVAAQASFVFHAVHPLGARSQLAGEPPVHCAAPTVHSSVHGARH